MSVLDGTKYANLAFLLSCSRPFEAALTRSAFQLLFLFIALHCIHFCYLGYLPLESHKHVQKLRFTALELRGGSSPENMKVSSIGVRMSGVDIPIQKVSVEGSVITADFDKEVAWDAWYLNTSLSSIELDPVRFYVENFDAKTGKWVMVGSSSFFAYLNSYCFIHGRFQTSTVRGQEEIFTVENKCAKLQLACKAATCMFLTSIALCGLTGKVELGLFLYKLTLYLWGGYEGWSSGEHLKGNIAYEPMLIMSMFWLCSYICIGCFQHQYVTHSFQVQSAFVLLICRYTVGRPHYGSVDIGMSMTICLLILTSSGVSVPLLQLWQKQQAKKQIMPDKLQYDQVWSSVLSACGAEFDELEQLVCNHRELCSEDARQYVQHGDLSPCQTLEDLYANNELATLQLRSSILKWGVTSNGQLHAHTGQDGSYVKAKDALAEGGKQVRWAPVKRRTRVVEKAIRVHGGDLSRVTDIVRECLIFDEVGDIALCLQEIVKDQSVEVVRIKNRLHHSFDAESTAGYRDVLINLRMLSMSWKVVEVQLILKQFDALKSKDGHRRYVAYRNSICA